jgi:hypothetical protein
MKTDEELPFPQERAELVEGREVQRQALPLPVERRIHREEAHEEVHEQPEPRREEEVGADREQDPMRQAAPD